MALYITILEAGELCSRDHELGTCGTVVASLYVDGQAAGVATTERLSFPKPTWDEVLELKGALPGQVLALVLRDVDPLQPHGRRLVFGHVPVRMDAAAFGLHERAPLHESPGNTGYLTFEISSSPPDRRRPPGADVPPGHSPRWLRPPPATEDEFCGVLVVSAGESHEPCRLEVSVGPGTYASWESKGAATPRRLWFFGRDPFLSVHATVPNQVTGRTIAAQGESQLSQVEGPRGPASLLLEPHPDALPLLWKTPEHNRERLRLHFRFLSADFLHPQAVRGLSVRITLGVCSPAMPLPLFVRVPVSCFSSDGLSGSTTEREVLFLLARAGDSTEICLPDSHRLVGDTSLWRIAPQPQGGPEDAQRTPHSCLLDLLALQLRIGAERTVTAPLGPHHLVLRVALTSLLVEVPRSASGLVFPAATTSEATPAEHLPPPESQTIREVAGILVHALAVHSPVVSTCLLFGGSDGGALFGPLPHQGRRVFVAAQANSRGRVLVHALLPEHGATAFAEALLGDGPSHLHWSFGTPGGCVHAYALVTCARWPAPAAGGGKGAAILPLVVNVLSSSVPPELVERFAPVTFRMSGPSGHAFAWDGAETNEDALLPVTTCEAGSGSLQLRSATSTLSTCFFVLELLALQHDAAARQAGLSLPVLVETPMASAESPPVASFYFLPVRVSILPGAVGRPCGVGKGETAAGVILLQGLSACAALTENAHHAECPVHVDPRLKLDKLWQPSAPLLLSAGRARGTGNAACHSTCAGMATWAPGLRGSMCIELLPAIACAPFDCQQGASGGIPVQIDVQLSCARCGAHSNLTAVPRTALLWAEMRTWQSFSVHMDVHSSGVHHLQKGAVACARLVICSSVFVNAPEGLLSVSIQPWKHEGPGMFELMEKVQEASRAYAEAPLDDAPVAMRLAIDRGAPAGPAVIIDGSADGSTQQLNLETTAKDLQRSITLEVQALSGGRKPMASVRLAALGFLGITGEVSYPLFFGPHLTLALVAEYEPLRVGAFTAVQGDSSGDDPLPYGPGGPEANPLATELRRLKRLVPAHTAPMRATVRTGFDHSSSHATATPALRSLSTAAGVGRAAAASAADRQRPRSAGCSHPYLDRGAHLWLAPRRGAAASAERHWTQGMDRKRPSHPTAAAQAVINMPKGWNDCRDSKEGPNYRQAFLSEQRKAVNELHDLLREARVEAQRSEKRLAQVRAYLQAVEQDLSTRGSASSRTDQGAGPCLGSGKRQLTAGARALPAGEDEAQYASEGGSTQVCSRCSTPIHTPAGRFCEGCLPGVLDEASALQVDLTGLLWQRTALRGEIERSSQEERRLAKLEARMDEEFVAGAANREEEQSRAVLEILAQLRTLQLDVQAGASLDAERADILAQHARAATARLQESTGRLDAAKSRNRELQAALAQGRQRIVELLESDGSSASARR